MRRTLAPALATLALAVPAGAAAVECPKTSLSEIENQVMCPVCGTPLGLATEAPQAEREREFIRRQVDACRSEDEIKAALVDEFGENVLALPGGDGFDLAAYVVPGLAVLLGAGTVAMTAAGWRRARRRTAEQPESSGAGARPGAPDEATTAQRDRLQTDLERYEL